MWLDKQNMFAEDQVLTHEVGTVASTNVVNLGDAKKGEGEPIEVLAQITTALSSLSSSATLQIKLITSASEDLSSSTTLFDSGALAIDTWVAGYQAPIRVLPNDSKQYLGFTFTTAGKLMAAGNISAGLVRHLPTNK